MDREDAIKELRKAQANTDVENAHCEADDVLCQLLHTLGYDDVLEEYEKVHKWYA